MTREDHLAWCKKRALACVERGELEEALFSMGKDLQAHPAFQGMTLSTMFLLGINYVAQGDAPAMRRWIEGFR
jgi:hypothetical protein